MRTSSDLIVDVRRSLCLTVGMAGVVTGVAIALYLAASNVAGRGAGVIAALAGVALLIACVKRSAHREPCIFTLRGDGSVDWVDRRGVRESGNVVAAGRVGGLWVSLRIESAAEPAAESSASARRTWLLPADALEGETFRLLAVRVPHMTAGRR
jgi:hypothetical protein